jgi:hypothetical protein
MADSEFLSKRTNPMTTTEKKLEKKLRAAIEEKGGLCLKLGAQFFTGLPDRLCLLPGGQAFFVELKSEKYNPSPRQLFVHKQLRKLGFTVFVAGTNEALDLTLTVSNYYTT